MLRSRSQNIATAFLKAAESLRFSSASSAVSELIEPLMVICPSLRCLLIAPGIAEWPSGRSSFIRRSAFASANMGLQKIDEGLDASGQMRMAGKNGMDGLWLRV